MKNGVRQSEMNKTDLDFGDDDADRSSKINFQNERGFPDDDQSLRGDRSM